MSQIVKCDICGGIYNQSHLSSHKRLSHGKREVSTGGIQGDRGNLEAIVSLYKELPEDSKREVLDRLAGSAPKLDGKEEPS